MRAAADGARRYLARPDIFHLHGVTGAMAVEILAAHIPATDGPPRWPTCTPSTPCCTRPPNR